MIPFFTLDRTHKSKNHEPCRLLYRYKIDSKKEDLFSARKLATDEIVWYILFSNI